MHKKTAVWILLSVLAAGSGGQDSPKNTPTGEATILEQLEAFMPGSSLKEIEPLYGKGENSTNNDENIGKRFYRIAKNGYTFSLWVQTSKDTVVDFYARLPDYLPHDRFHQALIDRYGKQDQYFRQDSSAVYRWNEENNNRIIYGGQCSLTCFTLYLTVSPASKPEGMDNYKPIFETLIEGEVPPP